MGCCEGDVKVVIARPKDPAPEATADLEPSLASPEVIRFDQTNLLPGRPGARFNSSLIDHGDGFLLAFRDGWKGSQIWIATLDRHFAPTGKYARLNLPHPAANWGREDPRLFRLNGHLHVSFTGVVGKTR